MVNEAQGTETTAPEAGEAKASVEATIESNVQGVTELSSCNNNNGDTSSFSSDEECVRTLEYADKLTEKGSRAAKELRYAEAVECYSRALEIRVAHYGELAPECVNAYFKYGCVLLYKAQEEADPLAYVPKKEGESHQTFGKDGSIKNATNGEISTASVLTSAGKDRASNLEEDTPDDALAENNQDQEEESDGEDLAGADDDDESDLDLAWKMLDVARAIVERHSDDTMEKVDILSALAEVSLEREDIETSLSDYLKALSILERLVEPDSRHIAELNFRICLCLEIGSKAQEAIPYCQRALSICKCRVQRLTNELNSVSGSAATSAGSNLDAQLSSCVSPSSDSASDKEAQIETLVGLSGELEKKLEDLQQLATNPTSILSDILGMVSAKARSIEKNVPLPVKSSSQLGGARSSGGRDSHTISIDQSKGSAGVTHLGIVGRGIKRVHMSTVSAESSSMKKPESDPTINQSDDKNS